METVNKYRSLVEQYINSKSIIERAKTQRGHFTDTVIQKVIGDYHRNMRKLSMDIMPLIQELVQRHNKLSIAVEQLKTVKPKKEDVQELKLLRKINAIPQNEYDLKMAKLFQSFNPQKLANLIEQMDKLEHLLLWWAEVSGETIPLQTANKTQIRRPK